MDGGRHHARPCLFWSRHRTEKTLPTWLSIQYATGAAWKKNKKSELFFSHKRLFFFFCLFFSFSLFWICFPPSPALPTPEDARQSHPSRAVLWGNYEIYSAPRQRGGQCSVLSRVRVGVGDSILGKRFDSGWLVGVEGGTAQHSLCKVLDRQSATSDLGSFKTRNIH